MAARITDSGEATPPPLPDALITPTTSGITNAEENTGPMNPTDWAITSGSDKTFAPRRSYAGSELAIVASQSSFLHNDPPGDPGSAAQPGIRRTLLAFPPKIAAASASGR